MNNSLILDKFNDGGKITNKASDARRQMKCKSWLAFYVYEP